MLEILDIGINLYFQLFNDLYFINKHYLYNQE